MLIKLVKYFVAITSFILGCMGVYQNTDEDISVDPELTYVEKENVDNYAYLRIPSIALSKPLYSKNDERNDIDSNLIFVEDSDTPLKKNGNVIIAGHSGSATVSYFKYLYKLEIGDFIYLEFNDCIYKYRVDNRYFVKKTGKVEIRRDTNTKTITLVTCYGNDKQLVVIGNIVEQIKK